MMRVYVACLASFVVASVVVVHPQSQPTDVISDPEAYRVYATLIPTLAPARDSRATNLVIQAPSIIRTAGPWLEGPNCLPTGLPTEWQSLTDSFKRENAQRRR